MTGDSAGWNGENLPTQIFVISLLLICPVMDCSSISLKTVQLLTAVKLRTAIVIVCTDGTLAQLIVSSSDFSKVGETEPHLNTLLHSFTSQPVVADFFPMHAAQEHCIVQSVTVALQILFVACNYILEKHVKYII